MEGRNDPGQEANRELRQIVAAVTACFFFSGATGLIYEVLWTRILGLVFGHTVFAITTVLAAFMAGLGLGSYLFGRIADRHPRPLLLYGVLEAGIGMYALLTPVLFSRAEDVYISLYRSFGLSFFSFSLAQFILIFLILLVPTTLMGATLPVLSRFFVHEIEALGRQVGRLYALNTFGAVLGTYAAGFHLIPALGVRTTLLLAAIVNIGIAALAVVFDRHLRQLAPQSSTPSAASSAADAEPASSDPDRPAWSSVAGPWLCVIGLGLSGAASMIYEVAWTRALSLTIGSSTYAFSTMLVAFLAGLALGSYLFARLAKHLRIDPFLFGGLQLGIGLSALAVMPFFDRLPELFLFAFRLSQSPGFLKVVQFGISALAMLLPTLFMGATFPCVAQIASRSLRHVGQDVGRIYFVNTGGAIVGTVLAGFLLIPTWGLQSTLKVAVSVNLCLAMALFLASRRMGWRKVLAIALPPIALVALFISPQWDRNSMASGVAIYGRDYFGYAGKVGFREAAASTGRLLLYRDGISATVSLHRRGTNLFLRVNGKTDASSDRDMHTQLMLGHLPLFLHPDPQRVLVIGLGSGVTVGAVTQHPVRQIDAIEIEPAVVEAAGYFAKQNRNALQNPKVHLSIADGRNFLLASEGGYDVIISEPSNPWMRGIGNLFSQEFYQLMASRLAPKGIVCQWIHRYGLFPDDLKMVVKTFQSVFPHVTVWDTTTGDNLLLGSQQPLVLDYAGLSSRYNTLPGVQEDMTRLGFQSPLSVLADFVLSERDTTWYAEQALLNTDDLPLLEFSAPQSLYVDTIDLNLRVMRAFKRDEFPPISGAPAEMLGSAAFRRDLGTALWAKGLRAEALPQFEEAVRLDPKDVKSLLGRGRGYVVTGSILKAEIDFKAALRIDPGMAEAHEALGQLYKAQGLMDLAEEQLRKAQWLRPKDPQLLVQLADFYRERRRFEEAIPFYLAGAAIAPESARFWVGLGLSYGSLRRPAEALDAFRRAVTIDPDDPLFHYQLGLAFLVMKRLEEAAAAFRTATLKDPMRPDPYLELGQIYRLQGKNALALESYRRALRLGSLNPVALRAVEELIATLESGS